MCSSEELILEIENAPVVCRKGDLISNSDYFKAMLEGNFVERNQTRIKLEGVDSKAMNIILKVLWDDTYPIKNEDLLLVLQTACMLQFLKIKNMCLERVIETLCPKNCVQVWRTTELLGLKPLFAQAKAMALEEFLEIKDTDSILEFSLEEIYHYLGHVNLKTDNEATVFQTAMKWWYENHALYVGNKTDTLIKLVSCIDFASVTEHCIKEIMIYPDIADNFEITQILSCVLLLKNEKPLEDFPETCQSKAGLLCKTRSRVSSKFPCVLVSYIQSAETSKKRKVDEEQRNVTHYDKYERKRKYEIVDEHTSAFNKPTELTVVYYDYNDKQFKKLIPIDEKKYTGLSGFKLMGYKEFVFMYGGEYLLGRGHWNKNFWVYDTIRGRWERKSVMPYPRRHFETCMVGEKLYLIGGTGSFRVIQSNMFWYNYKDDGWSAPFGLPCSERQLKFCDFQDKLFLFNINNKCGYFFDDKSFTWLKMDVIVDDSVLSKQNEFVIFSNKNTLYLKGKHLIEFKVTDKRIIAVSNKELANGCINRQPDAVCEEMQVVLCDSIIYTFYKYRYEEECRYSLETYNLDADVISYIFEDVSGDDPVITIDEDKYTINPSMKVLSFQHSSLVEKDILVNESFA
ncbi:hypothetical protein NQ315_016920 [Exocentrus adspersus]|uniref:BTB domain-containing protein n=1 Tax=Exocentrus adspersus TaxID=1586481 RepID=A0AAV8VXR4_9CUCU|nr:hypothetical protein NQ315_016920 [Exocentrus adspersus]